VLDGIREANMEEDEKKSLDMQSGFPGEEVQ
jgi:hypothetical protein